jgi:hypothetical protein
MSGLSHSTHKNHLVGTKLDWHSLSSALPFRKIDQAQLAAPLQILTEDEPLPSSRRLVVILPDADLDVFTVARRIWDLATPDCRQVLLLTKPYREENEFYSRVNLTSLAAIIRDPRVVVQTQIVLGMSLAQAAGQYLKPDDVFVCFEEHRVPDFLKKNRLAEILAQKTHRPVYTLKGPVMEKTDPFSARLIDFVLIAICLASLIGFFALEVWIDRNSTGMFHTLLQIMVVFVEVWVIAAFMNRNLKI